MKFVRKFLNRLINPTRPVVITAVSVFACALAGTVAVLVFDVNLPLAYFLYLLSALTLSYCVYLAVLLAKIVKNGIVEKANGHDFSRRFVNDYAFRTLIYAAVSFVINLGYTVYNAVYGFAFGEIWYVALAVYYLVLGICRGSVVYRSRKTDLDWELGEEQKEIRRLKIYRTAGALMLLLTVALNAVMWLVKNNMGGYRYYGTPIFVAAVYAFWKIITAVNNQVKAHGSPDYAVKALRNLNLVDALVSLFALQTAMLAPHGDVGYGYYSASFGTAICVFCAALGIFMIVKSSREIKKSPYVEVSLSQYLKGGTGNGS